MALIIWYLALVAAGDTSLGFRSSIQWGSYPSLIVFLAIYFVTLWLAWLIAVRLTEPKKTLA
jgi:hypothetical protein